MFGSGRNRIGHDRREVLGCANRMSLLDALNALRDSTRMSFVSKLLEQLLKCVRGGFCDELGCRNTFGRIESQVEFTAGLKTESAVSIGQLIRRQTKVNDDAVHGLDAEVSEDRSEVSVRVIDELADIWIELLSRQLEHHRVTVDSDEHSVRLDSFLDQTTVPGGSHCSIHHSLSRLQVEIPDDFPGHHRLVHGARTPARGLIHVRESGN